jgi:hypothetical protein
MGRHRIVIVSQEVRLVSTLLRKSRCAAALAFVIATWPARDARAFCRTITEKPGTTYDPATGCYTGSADAKLLYWNGACVGYSLNRSASSKVTLDQATTIVADAFATWSAAACDATGMPTVHAVDVGPVDCGLVEYNQTGPNQNLIVFRDDGWPYADPYNTLGLTTVTFNTQSGEIYDADMEINSAVAGLVAEGPVPPGGYDLKGIITHEAGHFLGLAHTPDPTAVMYAHYHDGESVLGADDVSGVCSIYTTGDARNTSAGAVPAGPCDSTPRHGFSTECGSLHPNPPAADTQGSKGGCSTTRSAGRGSFAMAWLVVLALAARRRPLSRTSLRDN